MDFCGFITVLLLFIQITAQDEPILIERLVEKYNPTWESIDSRPLPQWYDNSKIGVFIHWGVFAVPSFHSEWFWYNWKKSGEPDVMKFMEDNYPKAFTYQDFAKDFTAEFFNASDWAQLIKKSGAKYVVLTSKHHEGFTLWPSKYSFSWNAVDIGPNRDIIAELGDAVSKAGLYFGLYHSLYEWFNPLYLRDAGNNFTTQNFVNFKCIPEMKELVNQYKPYVLWSDGDWETSPAYWKSTEFLAWLYNESPVKDVVVVNDRWGKGTGCKHGGFFSCKDRYNPGVLQKHKWENAMTIDRNSWGFRRNAKLSDYLTINELLAEVISTVSCGGNILINVGPTKYGTISPIFEERLLQLGEWLSLNGEAIYESQSWEYQNDTLTKGVWYTAKGKTVYISVLEWPSDNILRLRTALELFKDGTVLQLLGSKEAIKWSIQAETVSLTFPDKATVKGNWAWVLKVFSL